MHCTTVKADVCSRFQAKQNILITPTIILAKATGINSRNTVQESLSGSDVERRVTMHVNRGEGTARVQHQLGYVHIPRIRRPVETHIQLLEERK